MDRAYSTLSIKAIDEEQRIITGIASTPTPDRMDDIVEPKGAQFKLPLPFLWQHRHSEPIGHVVDAKITNGEISVTVQLVKIDEPGTLKDRLDEAWQSIKSKLVRGLSIGFSSIESSDIDGTWGRRFTKWEWLELSAVTIPANSEANIQTIKSIDRQQRAALGQKSLPVVRLNPSAGVSANPKSSFTKSFSSPEEGTAMPMNIQEEIKKFEETLKQKQARMFSIMEKSSETGETLDAEAQEEYDTSAAEVKALEEHIKRLKNLEISNAQNAAPVIDKSGMPTRIPAVAKNTQKLEPGIEFARYAMCKLASKGNPMMAFELAKNHYPQNDRIVKALELQSMGRNLATLMKATVEAGTSLDATWAAPLVDYQNFAGDFVDYLRPRTIIGQFGRNGVPDLNRIPFNVRIAGQTSGGSASWVGEGAPKPLTAFDFTATELRWNKVAAISVLTNELIRFSDPSAERLVRDGLAAAVIERIDLDFVDPAKAASANVSPASITNGLTPIVSSGIDADAVRQDIQALWAPFIAARNAPRNAVYIMDSTTALALSMMQNPLGQSEFPGLTMNGGTFMGVPVVVSDYLPVDTDGSIVILANASDIWLADDNQVTIDASDQTALQMLDNPTNNSASGTATAMVSMFQTNSTAFRAERYINWARRRASGVAYLSGVRWGAAA